MPFSSASSDKAGEDKEGLTMVGKGMSAGSVGTKSTAPADLHQPTLMNPSVSSHGIPHTLVPTLPADIRLPTLITPILILKRVSSQTDSTHSSRPLFANFNRLVPINFRRNSSWTGGQRHWKVLVQLLTTSGTTC